MSERTTVQVGETYRFNNAVAVVDIVTDGEILWHEEYERSRANHRTPRWFFEKHSAPAPAAVRKEEEDGQNGRI